MFTTLEELKPQDHKALLLFSGGFDSTLVALLLKKRHIPTVALSYNFASRPRQEARTAGSLASILGFESHVTMDLPLSDDRGDPDKWPTPRHEGWFPYRNVIFFGIAAHLALKMGCNILASGIRIWDGPDFDDATSTYLEKLLDVLHYSGYTPLSGRLGLCLPLIHGHDYAEQALLGEGDDKQVLLSTWSCWRDHAEPCGTCAPCQFRAAFLARMEQRRTGVT